MPARQRITHSHSSWRYTQSVELDRIKRSGLADRSKPSTRSPKFRLLIYVNHVYASRGPRTCNRTVSTSLAVIRDSRIAVLRAVQPSAASPADGHLDSFAPARSASRPARLIRRCPAASALRLQTSAENAVDAGVSRRDLRDASLL